MVQVIDGAVAKQERKLGKAMGSGESRWRTNYFGGASGPAAGVDRNTPQAFLVDMRPNTTIFSHFHEVDQFQVLLAGSGKLGRKDVPLLALHYVDHHTAYGPIVSGPLGLSFFTIRVRRDSGPVYLHNPAYKDFLKPSKKRYIVADSIALSTEPVTESRSECVTDDLFPGENTSDGLSACVVRIGGGQTAIGSDPGNTAGQYYLVINGSLQIANINHPRWSLIYVSNTDNPFTVQAGAGGVEVLVLSFPRQE